jgi:type I restriction enzyme R subunit
MQAIARVNRVYKDKEGGLVVDYVGIASALKQAMNDYTRRDKAQYGDTDIAKTAYPRFVEKLEVCRGLLHGFNYSSFMRADASTSPCKAFTARELYGCVEKPEAAASQSKGLEEKTEQEASVLQEAKLLRQAWFSLPLAR